MEENTAVNIIVKHIKNIFTFECTEFSKDEFFKRMGLVVRSKQSIQLNWAEGVIFTASPYQPQSDIIVKEALKGNIYWSSVLFSLMPEYKPSLKFGAFEVPVSDQTRNTTLRQVAKWLKERLNSKNDK